MKNEMNKALLLLLLSLCLWGIVLKKVQAYCSELTILFTHDLHSNLKPASGEYGGFAALAAAFEQEKKTHANVLILDGGDFSMGSLFHILWEKQALELQFMHKLGYHATTLGNHEFDFGPESLLRMLSKSPAAHRLSPFLVATNLITPPELHEKFVSYVKPYLIVERANLKIGILALMGKEAVDDAPFARPLRFSDPIESAKNAINELKKENVNFFIALSHSGTHEDLKHSEDWQLAEAIPELNLIISAHTHTWLRKPLHVNNAFIVSAGYNARAYGKIIFSVDESHQQISFKSYQLHEFTKDSAIDSHTEAEIDAYEKQADAEYFMPLGFRSHDLIGESTHVLSNTKDSALGNLVADAFRYAAKDFCKASTGLPLSIVPVGTLRNSLPAQSFTVHDIFRVLSLGRGFDNTAGHPLVCLYFTPKEIETALEVETTIAGFKPPAALFVGGVSATYNAYRLPFARITSTELDTAPNEYGVVPVVMSYYTAKLISLLPKLSYHLLNIYPRNVRAEVVDNIDAYVIDTHPTQEGLQEIKEWQALARYIQTFPDTNNNGIPDLPEAYKNYQPRIQNVSNILSFSMIYPVNRVSAIALSVIIFILGTFFFLILRRKKRLR